MDPFVVSVWGTAALLIILFRDPNVPAFIRLQALHISQQLLALLFRLSWGAQLTLTRRSLRNDWLGRRLRDRELRAIQRNPAYREFFDGSLGAQRGSKEEH
jgi:hypothetical protein